MSSESSRVALVAGGSKGIGYAICQQLKNSGYKVVVASRNPIQAQETNEQIDSSTTDFDWIQFDMADSKSIESMVKQAHSTYGRLDAVVNSAGINYVAPVALANLERCNNVIQVNLMGAFVLSKAAVRIMTRQRSGRIVHIGSISGTIGSAYNAIYAASKSGVAGLTKSLALEVASLGITVNAVQPGTIQTELFGETHGARAKLKGISIEQQKKLMEDEYPHNRLITVEEVAAAVDFLLSDNAASITGHLLNVDGGRSII